MRSGRIRRKDRRQFLVIQSRCLHLRPKVLNPVVANLRLLAAPGVTPLEGGVPIIADGKVIGAIGVSGAASNQDAQCAMAGVAAAIGK